VAQVVEDNAQVMSDAQLKEQIADEPRETQDEILRISARLLPPEPVVCDHARPDARCRPLRAPPACDRRRGRSSIHDSIVPAATGSD
jgi:hypothetical protein